MKKILLLIPTLLLFYCTAQAQSVQFSTASSTVTEAVPSATPSPNIRVQASGFGGPTPPTVTVNITATNGTAESSDYSLGTTQLVINSNGQSTVTLTIFPDLDLDNETFTLTLSLEVGSPGAIGAQSTHTVNITDAGALPIELTVFSGKHVGSTIELHWRTATERDNAYMEVQRSKDGKRFEALQQVLSKTGGNSYTPQDYTFTDEQPLAGVNYYRLRQVDFDGKEEYHNIIAVLFQDKDFDQHITLFPTITKDQLHIALAQETDTDGELYISDMNGRVLLRQPFERGMQQYTWDLPQLAQGAYILSVKTGRELMSTRFVKN